MPQHPLGQLSPEDFIHRLEILRREAVHTKSGYTISFIFPSSVTSPAVELPFSLLLVMFSSPRARSLPQNLPRCGQLLRLHSARS